MDNGLFRALADLSGNEFLKYTLTTLIGFAGAYGAQWLVERRYHNRVRTSTREALALEVATNLQVLDSVHRTLTQARAELGSAGFLRWPSDSLKTATLELCLDPTLGSLLTWGEQTKISLVYYQLTYLQGEMDEAHDKILAEKSTAAAMYRAQDEFDRFLVRLLPVTAQNLVDFLVQLVEQQSVFASSELVEITEAILPDHSSGATHATRMWRTSGISETNPVAPTESMILVWYNDEPRLVPEGVRAIELRPKATKQFTVGVGEKGDTLLERWRLRRWRRDATKNVLLFRDELKERK